MKKFKCIKCGRPLELHKYGNIQPWLPKKGDKTLFIDEINRTQPLSTQKQDIKIKIPNKIKIPDGWKIVLARDYYSYYGHCHKCKITVEWINAIVEL